MRRRGSPWQRNPGSRAVSSERLNWSTQRDLKRARQYIVDAFLEVVAVGEAEMLLGRHVAQSRAQPIMAAPMPDVMWS